MKNRSLIIGLAFLSIIIGTLIWLFIQIPNIEKNLRENMTASVITDLSDLITNIEADILSHTNEQSLYDTIKSDKEARKLLEHTLEFLMTPSIKYVYVLHRDDNEHFHFMLDASPESEKAEFDEPFFVDNPEWHKAYVSGKNSITYEKGVPDLWITYVHPIIRNEKTEGMITLEFSKEKHFQLLELISPIQNAFIFVFIFIALVIGIAIFQLFQYFWIKKKSLTDPLTKLYNRQYLNEIKSTLNLRLYQVMMLDIDHFKQLNDTYGHQVGDVVLQKVAESIRYHTRSADILIRYGGEEFLLLLHNKTNNKDIAISISERIRLGVQESLSGTDLPIKPTISIGIETHTERTRNIDEAIRHADEMLYLAKRRGRNRVEVYEEAKSIDNSVFDKRYSITDIKEAIDEKRLICHFQPIADGDGEIIKYESLVRLLDKDGTLIMPGSFLPIISNTNIYNDLTKAVIDYCFMFFEDKNINFTINLKFSDLLNEAIVDILEDRLSKNNKMAERLTIELLEDEMIDDFIRMQGFIEEFQKMGVKFAIDDFGSGYANFGNIFKLDFNCLKIDGELIRNLDTSEYSKNMVESLSMFAKKANINVIAEYVENERIFELAKRYDIDLFQGYYIGKPKPEL